MSNGGSPRLCIYCGSVVPKPKKGNKEEHVIPEAIGGKLTLLDVGNRPVCSQCNNGVLSDLDRELCSRSHLSLIASRELQTGIWQAWDVDHQSNRLLLEASPNWASDGSISSFTCYPQIVFEETRPEVRGDIQQFQQFGDDAINVLSKAARNCFQRHRDGKKSIHFEQVDSIATLQRYRLPPRFYSPRPLAQLAQKVANASFVLRYVTAEDRDYALHSLANLNLDSLSSFRQLGKPTTLEQREGSRTPPISTNFDAGKVVRALLKLGVNLIASLCPNTPVSPQHFPVAINLVLGKSGDMPKAVLKRVGFTYNEDLGDIPVIGNAHSFRLVHSDGTWHVFARFFGGAIGTYVTVPGPNYEDWCSADIIAPLHSKQWNVTTSGLIPLMRRPRIMLNGGEVLTPSVPFLMSESLLMIEAREIKQRKRK